MGNTSVYKFTYLNNNDYLSSQIDKNRFQISENEIYGIYEFVGPGVVSGWDVISWNDSSFDDEEDFVLSGISYITQNEIDSLSFSQKKKLLNLNYKMVIRITSGDGIIDHLAGFTNSDFYYGFPNGITTKKWYVYAVPTPALPEPTKHLAAIYITNDSSYDSNYIATYLSTITTYYNSVSKENYILSVENESNRRRNLYLFKNIDSDELRKQFLRHVHDGKDVSRIKLDTNDIDEILDGSPAGSPLFLIDPIELVQSLYLGPEITSVNTDSYGQDLDPGVYYYQITFNILRDSRVQESFPGPAQLVLVPNNRNIQLEWQKVPGVLSYNIYRTENAGDSSDQIYLLKGNYTDFKFTDIGYDVIVPNTTPPQDSTSEVEHNISNINSSNDVSLNSGRYIINSDGSVSNLSYTIPGLFQTNSILGANQNSVDLAQNFYKVSVRLNGQELSPNDYKILTEESDSDTGLIELKNSLNENDVLDVIKYINTNETQVEGTLRKNRIDFLNAESFKYGILNKRYIQPPSHYGLNRIKENTLLRPYTDMKTSDYIKYTIEDPNCKIKYNDQIFYIGKSVNISQSLGVPTNITSFNKNVELSYVNASRKASILSKNNKIPKIFQDESIIFNSKSIANDISGLGKYILSSRSGNYITQDFQYFDLISGLDIDKGIIVYSIDNLVFGNNFNGQNGDVENRYYETYILLNTGKIFYTRDNFKTWDEIAYPRSDFVATAFSVSTSKSQVKSGDDSKGYNYGRRFYIGGYTIDSPQRSGVWEAEIQGSTSVSDISWEMMDVWKSKQNQLNSIYSILEIIIYTTRETTFEFFEFWNSSIYVSSNTGLYINNSKYIDPIYSSLIPKEISLLDDYNILVRSDDSLYTTKDAEFSERISPSSTSKSYILPLTRTIGRLYKIADESDFSDIDIISSSVKTKNYYMFGGNSAIYYGTENEYIAEGLSSDMLFDIEVYSTSGAGGLSFDVDIVSGISSAGMLFDVEVYEPDFVNNLLNSSDEDYAKYWGWNLPFWRRSAGSEYVDSPRSMLQIGYIRMHFDNGPMVNMSGRTGPLSGYSYIEEENIKYINFEYNLKNDNTLIDISFVNGISIKNIVNNSLINTSIASGTGKFQDTDNVLWISGESYGIVKISNSSGVFQYYSFEKIDSDSSNVPLSQLDDFEKINFASVQQNNSVFGASTGTLVMDVSLTHYSTNSVISGGNNGLWLAEYNNGSSFERIYNVCSQEIIPSIYKDDILVDESEYVYSSLDQSISFNEELKEYNKIIIEKDFKEFYLSKGGWSGSPDIIIYVNDSPSNINFYVDSEKGFILLDSSIDRKSNFQVSILSKDSYLNLQNSDEEKLDEYIPHVGIDNVYTITSTFSYLSKDLEINDVKIYVISTSEFPNNTKFIQIGNDRLVVSLSKNTFFVISGKISKMYPKGTRVYLVDTESTLSIQDRLSAQTSNGTTYYLHSIYADNLLKIAGSLRHIYPEITGQSDLLLSGYTNHEGFENSFFHIFGQDSYDDLNSFEKYRVGIDYDVDNPSKDSLQIFCSYRDIDFNTEGSLVGTDTGIWKKIDNYWKLMSSCNNCNRIYFIKKFRGDIWVGADTGAWKSEDDGETWALEEIYYQKIFGIETGNIKWSGVRTQLEQTQSSQVFDQEESDRGASPDKSKYYEIFLKDDGICFVLYENETDGTGDFDSDHIISVDSSDVFFAKQFESRQTMAASQSSTGRSFVKKLERIFIGGENGLYSIFNDRNIDNDITKAYSNFISASNIDIDDLEFYDMMFCPKLPYIDSSHISSNQFRDNIKYGDKGNIFVLLLTNNGLKISENFININNNQQTIAWVAEPLKDEGYICYSHIVIADPDSFDEDITAWKYTRMFLGTNKGVLFSLDGGFSWIPTNRFPESERATTYGLEYVDNVLYAFTNRGIFESENLGDSWIKSNIYLSHYKFFEESQKLSQTFKPEYNNIKKISVYMKKKFDVNIIDEEYEYGYESSSILNLKIYDENDGPGNTLLYTSPTTIFASDINEPRWINFVCDISLDSSNKYAIVIEESGFENHFLGWSLSPSATYANGIGYQYDGSDWNEIYNDFIFLVHYDVADQISREEFTIEYIQENANNIAVSTLNTLLLDMRFIFSFVIDGTGSMLNQDPNNYRITKISEFINKLLGRNGYSFIDLWTFDTDLIHLNNEILSDFIDVESSIASVISLGEDSEVWSGSSIAMGNAFYSSVRDYIANNSKESFVLDYMDRMKRIDHDQLYLLNNAYDKNYLTLLEDEFVNIRNIVIDDYIYTFGRIGFILTDGYDNASSSSDDWRAPALVMNGMKDEKDCPIYFFGIGRDNNQSSMIAAAESSGGKFIQIGDNPDKYDSIFEELLNGDLYIWQGKYTDFIDLGDDPQYLEYIECPAVIPVGWASSDLVSFKIRYTSDFEIWSDWQELDLNTKNYINKFVSYIEYEIVLKQADNISGDPYSYENYDNEYYDYGYYEAEVGAYPSPIIGAIKYGIIYPPKQIYMMNEIDSGNIFEYILTNNSFNSNLTQINWKVSIGNNLNTNNFTNIQPERKHVLPIRERDIEYTSSLPKTYLLSDLIPNSTTENRKIFFAVENNSRITWTNNDEIEIYLANNLVDPDIQHYRTIPSQGIVEFINQVAGEEQLSIKIIKTGEVVLHKGEKTTKVNNTTFLAANGPWSYDCRIIVYVDGDPNLSGYYLIPEEGKIIFDDNIPDDEEIRIYVEHSGKIRIAVEISSYDDTPVVLEDFAMMWSTIDGFSDSEILDIVVDPVATDVKLTIDENVPIEYVFADQNGNIVGNNYSVPFVKYSLSHKYGEKESGTEIKWFRKRKGASVFTEINEYYGRIFKNLDDIVDVYNPDLSSVWSFSSLWTEGDTWKVLITPKTKNSEGDSVYSNEYVVGVYDNDDGQISLSSSHPPIIYNLKIYKNDLQSSPMLISSSAEHLDVISTNNYDYYSIPLSYTGVLKVKFQFSDEDTDQDDDVILNEMIVRWRKQGESEAVYDSARTEGNILVNEDDKWEVPKIGDGETWYCEIIPFDGISYGQTIRSLLIERAPTGE